MNVCPVCERQQDLGLVCSACCDVLERDLAEVRALMGELDVSLSMQAKIGGGAGKSGKGWAREKLPINMGASIAAGALTNVLATWVVDVCGEDWPFGPRADAGTFALDLLGHINEIRRHPAADELFDQIIDAIKQARYAIDRPSERQYLGQCLVDTPDPDGRPVTCLNEIYARIGATETTCSVCGITHEVAERRAWLLQRAQDMIVTVKEAATFIGEVGGIKVSQASIRGYLHRGRIAYRPGVTNGIRLGDLLAVVLDDSERKGAA